MRRSWVRTLIPFFASLSPPQLDGYEEKEEVWQYYSDWVHCGEPGGLSTLRVEFCYSGDDLFIIGPTIDGR